MSAKIKFSPALFQKLSSFVCLAFKIENKLILKLQICFLEKQADLKTKCTRLWRFVLMITYNILTRKLFLFMV